MTIRDPFVYLAISVQSSADDSCLRQNGSSWQESALPDVLHGVFAASEKPRSTFSFL